MAVRLVPASWKQSPSAIYKHSHSGIYQRSCSGTKHPFSGTYKHAPSDIYNTFSGTTCNGSLKSSNATSEPAMRSEEPATEARRPVSPSRPSGGESMLERLERWHAAGTTFQIFALAAVTGTVFTILSYVKPNVPGTRKRRETSSQTTIRTLRVTTCNAASGLG